MTGPVVSPTAHPRLAPLARGLSAVSTVALYIAGAFLVLMTIIVFWQVFTRYVLNWSNAWTELTSILLMSWFIFLGAAVGVRENYHLGFDVLLYVLPRGAKKYLRTISDLVVLSFAIGMVIYGIQLIGLQWKAKMPALGITEGARYMPLAAGGFLVALFSIERIVLRWAGIHVDFEVVEEAPAATDPEHAAAPADSTTPAREI